MARLSFTERFPFLRPLRVFQRRLFFYLGMRLDGRRYCRAHSAQDLSHLVYTSASPLYNRETGFPMLYQENKVHNLRLAAKKLDGLLLRPGETFSFYRAVRGADRDEPYRDGLTVVDGRLITAPGGGMCQMSNLLFWLFLHAPLRVVERHGHRVKDFPDPPSDAPRGVDATLYEGWLDLKVLNPTETTYEIRLDFTDGALVGRLLADRDDGLTLEVRNGEVAYVRRGGEIYEEADVLRRVLDRRTGGCLREETLYRNVCRVGYDLPAGTPVREEPLEGGKEPCLN